MNIPNKKTVFIIVTTICIFLFGFIYIIFKPKNDIIIQKNDFETVNFNNENQNNDTNTKGEINNTNNNIVAYITGEVNNPDVYELEEGSRVKDLVLLSGGFTEDADANKINLSKKLFDEDHIHIYKIGDNIEDIENINTTNSKNNLININKADKNILMTLPSIGETIASNIIDYREKNGKFSTIEEIKNVDRIGDKTFEKIKDLITIN